MHRIHNSLTCFPPNILTPSPIPTFFSRSYDHLNNVIPFCKTMAYKNSFIPSSIKLWNLLDLKNCKSLRSFKFLPHCSAN